METVHILPAVDGCDDLVGVDVFRKRQLHEDTVHLLIGIQLLYQRQHLRFGNRLRTADGGIPYPYLVCRLGLARHIRHTARVLADKHHHQMRYPAVFLFKFLHSDGHLPLHLHRKFFPAYYHNRLSIYSFRHRNDVQFESIPLAAFPEREPA